MEKKKLPPKKIIKKSRNSSSELFCLFFEHFLKKLFMVNCLRNLFSVYKKSVEKSSYERSISAVSKNRKNTHFHHFPKTFLKRFCTNTLFVIKKVSQGFSHCNDSQKLVYFTFTTGQHDSKHSKFVDKYIYFSNPHLTETSQN